MTSLMKALKET